MSDRTETIKPVRIDLGDGDSLNLYRMSDYVTVVRFHGNNPDVQLSSAQVSTTALRAALDEVAPAGSYTRTESPDLLDGGMMCAAIEAEAASDTLLLVQQQRDQATARAEKAERERDEVIDEAAKWQADALRRAQERDEARATAHNWEATAEEWEKRALAAEPRPLTPDANARNVVDFLAAALANLADEDRDYLARILAKGAR